MFNIMFRLLIDINKYKEIKIHTHTYIKIPDRVGGVKIDPDLIKQRRLINKALEYRKKRVWICGGNNLKMAQN